MLLVQPVVATGYQRTILGYAVMGEPLFEEGVILNNSVKSYIFNALLVMLVSTLLSAYAYTNPWNRFSIYLPPPAK